MTNEPRKAVKTLDDPGNGSPPGGSGRWRRIGWSLLLWAAASCPCAGLMSDFGPFPDSEEVVRVPVRPCPMVRTVQQDTSTIEEFALPEEPEKPFLTLEVDHPSPEQWSARLMMNLGANQPTYGVLLNGASYVIDVLTADLNGDKRPDFIVPYTVHRKESAKDRDEPAPGESVLFALSGGEGHRFALVENVKFDADGIISLLNDGTVQWVHAVLVDRHDAKSEYPGRKLYFYLYRLFTFRGDTLEPADSMDPRFPKFVSYYPGTKRKNHKATQRLTEEQEKALVQRYPLQMPQLEVGVKPALRPPFRRAVGP